MSGIWIGTSGWTYKGWRELFYPRDVPQKRWLRYYSSQFNTTEINGSFYRTPSLEAVRAWRKTTSDDFVFAWKASKYITHWKRLTEKCENSLELMETRLRVLGHKIGPILFQLPARFTADRERLGSFLNMLSKKRRYSFEFRHESWYENPIFDLLSDHNVSLCFADHHLAPAPWEVTADHVYIRGHGPTGKYRDNYSDKTLAEWARKVSAWKRRGLDVFCYFDNDHKSAAPQDGKHLMELLRLSR